MTDEPSVIPPSAYRVCELVGVSEQKDMPGHLYFFVAPDYGDPIPVDQQNVRDTLENVCSVLRVVFQNETPKLFREFFDRLLLSAQAAFSPNGFRPEAISDLSNLKTEVVQTAGAAIKTSYTKRLLLAVIVASALIAVLTTGCHWLVGRMSPETSADVAAGIQSDSDTEGKTPAARWDENFSIINTGLLLAAAMWGLLFASMARAIEPTFETLLVPDADLMPPWFRLIFYGFAILVLAFLFQLNSIGLSFGESVSTAKIDDDPITALTIGALLGIAERALPKEITYWSSRLLAGTGRN